MFSLKARYQFSPLAIAFNWQVETTTGVPARHNPPKYWQWQYQFDDKSILQGQFREIHSSRLTSERHSASPDRILKPVGETLYLTHLNQTPLLHWQPLEFSCFDIEPELLIMASLDNYVGNSLCLINCPQRQWAQITHWGSQLVSEPFNPARWSMTSLDISPISSPTILSWQWHMTAMGFPRFRWQLNATPSNSFGSGSGNENPPYQHAHLARVISTAYSQTN